LSPSARMPVPPSRMTRWSRVRTSTHDVLPPKRAVAWPGLGTEPRVPQHWMRRIGAAASEGDRERPLPGPERCSCSKDIYPVTEEAPGSPGLPDAQQEKDAPGSGARASAARTSGTRTLPAHFHGSYIERLSLSNRTVDAVRKAAWNSDQVVDVLKGVPLFSDCPGRTSSVFPPWFGAAGGYGRTAVPGRR
jgi:hypothetical protein